MIKIDVRNLGIPLLLFLFVCLFVCLFLLLNQGNNMIFPKQTSWNSFVAIHLFFLLNQMKRYGIIILFSFC